MFEGGDLSMPTEDFVKYGGIKFINNVSPAKINKYVRELPENQRHSLFQVVRRLDRDGLISLDDSELTTIDDETIQWQE